jgi:hypothetical protein
MRTAFGGTRVTLRLALDTMSLRNYDKSSWAMELVEMADRGAPQILRVEGYELGETVLTIRMVSFEPVKRLRKLLQDDYAVNRLRAQLGDNGARPDFEIDEPGPRGAVR